MSDKSFYPAYVILDAWGRLQFLLSITLLVDHATAVKKDAKGEGGGENWIF